MAAMGLPAGRSARSASGAAGALGHATGDSSGVSPGAGGGHAADGDEGRLGDGPGRDHHVGQAGLGHDRDPRRIALQYCLPYVRDSTLGYMKTMIDLNDEALSLAAKELGTTTKKDTVNAALDFVANRRRRIEQLLDDPYALGVGPDITDPEVMRQARR
jgi:Arc/MetJ family transcription regulator